MLIKHKKGRFSPSIFTRIWCWSYYLFAKLLGNSRIEVTLEFSEESKYYMGNVNQFDWLKAFGCKSGTKTITNREFIIAYRYIPMNDVFQVCQYIREPITGFTVSYIKEVKSGKVTFGLPLKYRFPVAPYAGGNEKPKTSFKYKLKLR